MFLLPYGQRATGYLSAATMAVVGREVELKDIGVVPIKNLAMVVGHIPRFDSELTEDIAISKTLRAIFAFTRLGVFRVKLSMAQCGFSIEEIARRTEREHVVIGISNVGKEGLCYGKTETHRYNSSRREFGLWFNVLEAYLAGQDPVEVVGWEGHLVGMTLSDIDKDGKLCAIGAGVLPIAKIIGQVDKSVPITVRVPSEYLVASFDWLMSQNCI